MTSGGVQPVLVPTTSDDLAAPMSCGIQPVFLRSESRDADPPLTVELPPPLPQTGSMDSLASGHDESSCYTRCVEVSAPILKKVKEFFKKVVGVKDELERDFVPDSATMDDAALQRRKNARRWKRTKHRSGTAVLVIFLELLARFWPQRIMKTLIDREEASDNPKFPPMAAVYCVIASLLLALSHQAIAIVVCNIVSNLIQCRRIVTIRFSMPCASLFTASVVNLHLCAGKKETFFVPQVLSEFACVAAIVALLSFFYYEYADYRLQQSAKNLVAPMASSA